MCGIAGILTRDGAPGPDPRGVSESLLAALAHRGPDDRGLAEIRAGGTHGLLAHTRLAILDLSSAGHQPMSNPGTGDLLTLNGEIYNFRSLRAQLPEPWRSTSDGEVLLKGYAAWGRGVLERLRGMFAFGLWDARRQELFLARDRFGIKPLYYVAGNGFFAFASEVRALLSAGLAKPELDPDGLWSFLGYQAPAAPSTLIRGIRSLPAGSWLSVGRGGELRSGTYWDLHTAAQATRDD